MVAFRENRHIVFTGGIESLIQLSLTCLGHAAPVALLIEPPGPWTQRDEPSLQEPWPVFVKSAGQMSR